jgi:hypothetical protein
MYMRRFDMLIFAFGITAFWKKYIAASQPWDHIRKIPCLTGRHPNFDDIKWAKQSLMILQSRSTRLFWRL